MKKITLVAGLALILVVPAVSVAKPTPDRGDKRAAKTECKTLRGHTDATREAFAGGAGAGVARREKGGQGGQESSDSRCVRCSCCCNCGGCCARCGVCCCCGHGGVGGAAGAAAGPVAIERTLTNNFPFFRRDDCFRFHSARWLFCCGERETRMTHTELRILHTHTNLHQVDLAAVDSGIARLLKREACNAERFRKAVSSPLYGN